MDVAGVWPQCVDLTTPTFLLWVRVRVSYSSVIHASHAGHWGAVNWLMWGYLWTSVRAPWLTVSSVGGNAFTHWEIYTIPFLSTDSAHLIYLMALVSHLQSASPVPFTVLTEYMKTEEKKKTYASYSRRKNTWTWPNKHMHTFWNKTNSTAMQSSALS